MLGSADGTGKYPASVSSRACRAASVSLRGMSPPLACWTCLYATHVIWHPVSPCSVPFVLGRGLPLQCVADVRNGFHQLVEELPPLVP
jgi:hypothetical protein